MNINLFRLEEYRLYCFLAGYYQGTEDEQAMQLYKNSVKHMEDESGWSKLEDQVKLEDLDADKNQLSFGWEKHEKAL